MSVNRAARKVGLLILFSNNSDSQKLLPSIPLLRLHLLSLLKVLLTLRAVPFQFLAMHAQVPALPALASEHQSTAQIAAPTAGREFAGFKGEFHRAMRRRITSHTAGSATLKSRSGDGSGIPDIGKPRNPSIK